MFSLQTLVILVITSGPYMCHRQYQMWCQGRCDCCQSAELRNIDHTQNGVRTNGITSVFGDFWRLASSFLCMSGSYFQRWLDCNCHNSSPNNQSFLSIDGLEILKDCCVKTGSMSAKEKVVHQVLFLRGTSYPRPFVTLLCFPGFLSMS